MKLGNRRKTVRETLRAQIQQRLHENLNFQWIKPPVALFLRPRVRQILQNAQNLLRGALLPYRDDQLMGRRCAGQCSCKTNFTLHFPAKKIATFLLSKREEVCAHFFHNFFINRTY